MFLDATTTASSVRAGAAKEIGGLGGLFSSLMPKKDSARQQNTPQPKSAPSNEGWLDVDLIQSAIHRGSRVFVVCEASSVSRVPTLLSECLSYIDDDNIEYGSVATIVAPDDGVALGAEINSEWMSLRPQDLEGELSEPVSIRDGTRDPTATNDDGDQRYDETDGRGPSLSRHDLAEVCVQCALQLSTSTANNGDYQDTGSRHRLWLARVAPCGGADEQ